MPRNPNQLNRPNQNTPQRPPQPQHPQRPRPPISPQPPRPQSPPRPPHAHNPRWPQGLTPNMPVMPRPPAASFMPHGFPMRLHGRIGLVVSPRGGLTIRRRPSRMSRTIGIIPHHTFVWVFGENNGWSLIHHGGQFGFVPSVFIIM